MRSALLLRRRIAATRSSMTSIFRNRDGIFGSTKRRVSMTLYRRRTRSVNRAASRRHVVVETAAHVVDAAGAAAQERQHLLHGVAGAEVAFHLGHGGGKHEALAEEHLEGAADGIDLLARH